MLRCGIHNNENYASYVENLPNLDELLVSNFDPHISDNEEDAEGQEDVGGQEDADSLGLFAWSHFCRVPTGRIQSQERVTIRL